jgi:hypothetical protein
VLTLSLRAAPDGSALLTLFNASAEPQTAAISSGLVHICAAQRCDVLGDPVEALAVKDGTVEVPIASRQTMTLKFS